MQTGQTRLGCRLKWKISAFASLVTGVRTAPGSAGTGFVSFPAEASSLLLALCDPVPLLALGDGHCAGSGRHSMISTESPGKIVKCG